MWKYFLKNRLQARAKCILCGQILEIKGGTTTSLSRHLRKRHGNECTDIPLPEVGTRKPELALNKFVECETILSENSFEETQVGFSPKILPSETSILEK